MRAGPMDRRITLRHRVIGPDDANGSKPTTTWTAYKTVWARKIEVSSRLFVAAAQNQAESSLQFQIRYRSDIEPTDRVTFDGEDYEFTGPPAEIGRREGLTLFCRAIKRG